MILFLLGALAGAVVEFAFFLFMSWREMRADKKLEAEAWAGVNRANAGAVVVHHDEHGTHASTVGS